MKTTKNATNLSDNKRIIELDALRGLAAIAVVFSHILIMLPEVGGGSDHVSVPIQLLSMPPFRITWGGSEAVVLFFVLSGFVLSLPYLKGSVNTKIFLIKRFLRIYPAYIATVLISLIAYRLLSGETVLGFSDWFYQIWPETLTIGTIVGHVLLIGAFDNDALNPVLWTLVMEMRIALLFPLIMWAVLRLHWHYSLAFALLIYIAGRGFHWYSNSVLGYENDLFLTLMFVYQFVVGALIAKNFLSITTALAEPKAVSQWAIFLLSFSLLQYSAFFSPSFQPTAERFLGHFPTTLGVAILIPMVASNDAIGSVLRNPILQFLGKISYSLYLVHAIVLISIVYLLHHSIPYWLIVHIAIFISTLTAWLLFILVEQPSMALSKRMKTNLLKGICRSN